MGWVAVLLEKVGGHGEGVGEGSAVLDVSFAVQVEKTSVRLILLVGDYRFKNASISERHAADVSAILCVHTPVCS